MKKEKAVIKTELPIPVYDQMLEKAVDDHTSINHQHVQAIWKVHGADLPADLAKKWSDDGVARAEAQRGAVASFRDAMDERWLNDKDFFHILGLNAYQQIALAHVLWNVADTDEEQALPACLRLIILLAQANGAEGPQTQQKQ